jgi:hypothetical protein
LLNIIDSANGDVIGSITITGMDDEHILDWLILHSYLAGSADMYEITRSYPFAEGEIIVLDMDTQAPVLKLEVPPDGDDERKAA